MYILYMSHGRTLIFDTFANATRRSWQRVKESRVYRARNCETWKLEYLGTNHSPSSLRQSQIRLESRSSCKNYSSWSSQGCSKAIRTGHELVQHHCTVSRRSRSMLVWRLSKIVWKLSKLILSVEHRADGRRSLKIIYKLYGMSRFEWRWVVEERQSMDTSTQFPSDICAPGHYP